VAFALAGCGKSGTKDEHAGEGDKQAAHAGEKKEGHSEAESELTLTTEEAARAGIKVEEVKPQALGETLTVTATIRPDADRLAHVAARIEGRITAVAGKAGRQGARRPDAGHAGQRGRRRSARRLDPAQAELGIADADFKRAESLNAEEIIPRKDFLRAKADRDKAAAALRAAADRLRLLGGAQRQRRRGLGLRRHRALCRHRHREEGHAG
jgi:cobalt-zinc-cadmium efflux system membrane fusion protein